MAKKLTYRQQQFLSQFLDAYQEMHEPMHYAVVAERTGVNKVTAYEMLRLLEEHGLVRATYQMNMEQHGPGRPTVLFFPTREADQLINMLAGDSANQADWYAEKTQILMQLRNGKINGYEELLSDLLNRVSEKRSSLIFLTELITSVILTLSTFRESPEINAIIDRLRKIGLPQEISLGVFSGISMLLAVMEKTNRASATFLLSQMNRYEEALMHLNDECRTQLSEYTREVVQILFS